MRSLLNPVAMRTFETGATRDTNDDKPDYRGFLSMKAIRRFGAYMLKHRQQADGTLRASDNWKKGIPQEAYVESGARHFVEWLDAIEDGRTQDAEELACAIWFNIQGWLHERMKSEPTAMRAVVGPGDTITYVPVQPKGAVLDPCDVEKPAALRTISRS